MPGFDGTGPGGQGALTGRGRGACAVPVGGNAPLLRQGGMGFGMGRGRGLGRGRGNCYRSFRGSVESVPGELADLQLKCTALQAEIQAFKEKSRQV